MKSKSRVAMASALVLLTSIVVAAFGTQKASADAVPDVCGAGFFKVATLAVDTPYDKMAPVPGAAHKRVGSVVLYWNRATQENCAVVIKDVATPKAPSFMGARIVNSQGDQPTVTGEYTHYAWVKAHSPGCIQLLAQIDEGATKYGYMSSWDWCRN